MTPHLNAKLGEIAEFVLLPGDPRRARFVAENYLEDVVCYNEVRAMYGFTGTYKGKRVSVQGTGMGAPSIAIYAHELINSYGVKNLIRIGSCGALQPDLKLREVILAQAASNDSIMNRLRFNGRDFAPTADFDLLKKAYDFAQGRDVDVRVGNILSSDIFYADALSDWQVWIDFGVLAVEMETAALYTLAAQFHVRALSILTVSNHVMTNESIPPEQRENSFVDMMEIALALA